LLSSSTVGLLIGFAMPNGPLARGAVGLSAGKAIDT
jgi:hypothetical protein